MLIAYLSSRPFKIFMKYLFGWLNNLPRKLLLFKMILSKDFFKFQWVENSTSKKYMYMVSQMKDYILILGFLFVVDGMGRIRRIEKDKDVHSIFVTEKIRFVMKTTKCCPLCCFCNLSLSQSVLNFNWYGVAFSHFDWLNGGRYEMVQLTFSLSSRKTSVT